jgi:hypothetical protein
MSKARDLTAGVVAALAATVLAACGGTGSETDPPAAELVREAAVETMREPVAAITLISTGSGSYEYQGLMALSKGQFRVGLVDAEGTTPGFDAPKAVIGTDGEGYESTSAVLGRHTRALPGAQRGPCWFNPHAPVGSLLGTLSVEEAARLSGSVVESLGAGEIVSAGQAVNGEFSVELKSSASQPRNDFDDSKRRIWGDRKLLASVERPVVVRIANGRVSAIEVQIEGYEDEEFGRTELTPQRAVTLVASFEPTDDPLELHEPRCHAIQ